MAPLWMRRAAATENAPADDVESSDCGICFLPLDSKAPPTFQCDAGNVICSSCRDMLELPEGRCHVCCQIGGHHRPYEKIQTVEVNLRTIIH